MKNKTTKQVGKLGTLMSMSALDGAAAVSAIAGLFTFKNAPTIAILLIAGPSAILSAALLEGVAKERMFVALISGLIATSLVMLSAGFGPKLLELVNKDLLRISGAISIGTIALIIGGLKIPNQAPLAIMSLGLVGGLILK